MTRPTPELKAAIVSDRAAGMSVLDTAAKHDVSESTVKRVCSEARRAAGVPVRKQAKARAYTEEQRRQILDDHYYSGSTIHASAKAAGVTHKTLALWIRNDRAWMDPDSTDDIDAGWWVLCRGCRIQIHTTRTHKCSRRAA